MEQRIEHFGDRGLTFSGDSAVLSFNIIRAQDQMSIDEDKAKMAQKLRYAETFAYENFTVGAHGEYNNLPGEVREMVRNNHLLPELLKKQARFMYGQGPFLYTESESEEGKKRNPVSTTYPQVFAWLDSWKENGLPQSFAEYAKQTILEYYYIEGHYTQYHFNKSRRIGGNYWLPIRGLSHVPSVKARLAMEGLLETTDTLERDMLTHVLVGRWDMPYRYGMDVYPLFDAANPFKNPVAVNYTADYGFGETIYSIPTFYYGLKEWILGSNLNPKYINSYLKNSLNAKIHVVIPDSWINSKEKTLRKIVEENQTREQTGKPLQKEYEGLKEIGTTFDYSMLNKLIDAKLLQLTSVLGGAGENQGKTFFTRAFRTEYGIEKWEFEDIPTKYSEFVKSIIDFDTRAVQVILAGKGLDPSISNVTKDGVFPGSGSQAYYNYLIYMLTLPFAEEFCVSDINTALWINFPELKRNRVKLGFFRNVPMKQAETTPSERMGNTANN